jgi:hypothetical protein
MYSKKEVVELFNEYNNKYSVSNLDNHRIPRFLIEKGLTEDKHPLTAILSQINKMAAISRHVAQINKIIASK